MKTLLMLSWEYPPRIIGGLARVVAELSKQMVKAGWEVHVVTADHPNTPEYEIVDGVNVHRVKTASDPCPDFLTWVDQLNFGMLRHAIQLHRQKPFSILHAHDWMVTDAAWVMKSGFGIPLIATIHATEAGRMHGIHNDLQRYIHQLEWRLTFEAWSVIVNSKHMSAELKRLFGLPADKTVLIPNGTNPEVFDFDFDPRPMRAQYAGEHEKIILYVGRMVHEKGVQVLLDAAPKILNAYPNTRFLLVGAGGYLEDLKRRAGYLNIWDRVSFLGYVSDDDLRKFYKLSDVVVIPSLYEPFGIVALEGMAAGVPVVTSDAGGLTDFVEHMVTGVTTYAGDSGSLAWGILEVLKNPQLAKLLTNNACEKVRTIYNWKALARETMAVYSKVLSEAAHLRANESALAQPAPPNIAASIKPGKAGSAADHS